MIENGETRADTGSVPSVSAGLQEAKKGADPIVKLTSP